MMHRCWQRTGIIPEEYGTEDMSVEIEKNNETVIQPLLNRINMIDLTATDYIDIDSTPVIDDNKIIKAVQEATENEEETEEDKCPLVSDKIALETIKNLLN